jgi:hypothetical protein
LKNISFPEWMFVLQPLKKVSNDSLFPFSGTGNLCFGKTFVNVILEILKQKLNGTLEQL